MRGYFTTESKYILNDFFQSLIYWLLYYFVLGGFTNIILFAYEEEDKPKYMAKMHGFRVWKRAHSYDNNVVVN